MLNLARQSTSRTQKKHRGIKEPDTFSGGSSDDLQAFIFQCQIYFRACEGEFVEDTDRIFFVIFYLRGIALDYFEPFINEPDPSQDFDFLEDWSAFTQKLANVFGSYTPEDDDEDAIIAIPFPPDGKAVTYFIQFAKYQNRIRWGDRSLRKVVKDAILPRISEELRYSKEDLSTFEGLKRAVQKIDSDYWRRVSDDKQKQQVAHTLQNRFPRSLRLEPTQPPNPIKTIAPPTNSTDRARTFLPSNRPTQFSTAPSILGPDGKLTPLKRQRRMDLGLCLRCGNMGHLARSCPHQPLRQTPVLEGRAALLEIDPSQHECHKPLLLLKHYYSFLLLSILFIAWESLSHYVT